MAEKICERFKTERTLTDELEERLEDISFIRALLHDLPNDLSKVVDKLTFSFVYGFASVVSIIIFAYTLGIDSNSAIASWMQIIFGVIALFCVYQYVFDGLRHISPLRKFEKKVNNINRSTRFDELYEIVVEWET